MATRLGALATLGVVMALSSEASAAGAGNAQQHWITSWYAAPQPRWDSTFVLPANVPATLANQTLHEQIRLSAGGQRVRLVFSNRYGKEPLQIGEVRVGLAGSKQPARRLSFGGQASVSILAGASATSDALEFALEPLAELTVSTYLPVHTAITGFHWGGQQTLSVTPGALDDALSAAPERFAGRLFLNAVMVEAPEQRRSVAILGDSITDGNGSTPDANRRWPDFLARRLAPYGVGVANAGISGARLASDGMGQSALARLEHDVLSQPGISDVIVLLGINDIGWPGSPFAPNEAPASLERLSAAYRQLVSAAHVRGVRVTAATLPPFEGALEGTPFAGHYSPAKEGLRQRFNGWIRSAGVFDAVIDFDALLRDPAHPRRLRPAFDSGDHLHPGDAGYRAMAEAVEIRALTGQERPAAPAQEAAE